MRQKEIKPPWSHRLDEITQLRLALEEKEAELMDWLHAEQLVDRFLTEEPSEPQRKKKINQKPSQAHPLYTNDKILKPTNKHD